VVRGVAVVRSVVLARLLDPAGFGVFGIAIMVLALLELMTETGINIFFLQNRDKIDKYLNTAWVISIIRGFLISVLVLAITYPITDFFNAPQARPLLFLMSIVPIIRGFLNPSTIKFQRNLEFHREFVYRGTITVMETVAMIDFTWWLANPIGLVLGLMTAGLTEVAMSYLLIKPWPKFKLIASQARDIISSGKWVTGFIVLDYLFTQSDNIVVGRLLGTAPLGIYRMSYTLSTLPVTEISDVFYKVAFPTFSKMITEKKN
jgi:O-antigen/teichoic acid export membrane protein